MKSKKYRASDERTVLTGMIVHDDVLDAIFRNLKGERSPFKSKWSNIIAKWCLDYWEKYRRAPKRSIENRFVKFSESSQDTESVELVEIFLRSLSKDLAALGQEMNAQFVIDVASRHFNEVKYGKLIKQMERSLEVKDIEAVTETFHAFEPIEFVAGQHPDPFDPEQQRKWLAQQETETLVEFPNALGKFIGNAFERDSFIAFAGPEKRGKSYWLLDVVWRAVKQRRRVLYYVVGDMSEKQAMIRLLKRATLQPRKTKELEIPARFVKKNDKITVRKRMQEKKGLTPKTVAMKMKKVMQLTATKEPRLKTRIFGSSTICASDIESEIAHLSKQDWVPDVVVIDYADILTCEPHSKHMEYRHQINETWKTLRRISQRFHLCLVTATQTAATSYEAKTIKKSDFSEDKRKGAHVTGMLGINQTPEEKVMGVYRLNWIFFREGAWAEHQVVHTAGNLGVACPCLISSLL